MSIIKIDADIFTVDTDIIAHQVNCKGVMGAGLAAEIAKRYPKVEEEYKVFCNHTPSSDLLGACQIIDIGDKYIANLFGQNNYGRTKVYTKYRALEDAMKQLLLDAKTLGLTKIAFPYGIGCGLAGGDWITVSYMMYCIFKDPNITAMICSKPG